MYESDSFHCITQAWSCFVMTDKGLVGQHALHCWPEAECVAACLFVSFQNWIGNLLRQECKACFDLFCRYKMSDQTSSIDKGKGGWKTSNSLHNNSVFKRILSKRLFSSLMQILIWLMSLIAWGSCMLVNSMRRKAIFTQSLAAKIQMQNYEKFVRSQSIIKLIIW